MPPAQAARRCRATMPAGRTRTRRSRRRPDYFEARFTPVANKPYRVWMRLRANADSKFNDSIWLQYLRRGRCQRRAALADWNGERHAGEPGVVRQLRRVWLGLANGRLVGAPGFDRAIPRSDRTDAARANSRRRRPNRSDYPQPDDLPRFAARNADQRHEHRAKEWG